MGSAVGPVDYIEEPFEVEIVEKPGRGPIAFLTWPSGLRRAIPLDIFCEEHRRAGAAIAGYQATVADGGRTLGLSVEPFRVDCPPCVALKGDDALLTLKSGPQIANVCIPIPFYRQTQDDGDNLIAAYDAGQR